METGFFFHLGGGQGGRGLHRATSRITSSFDLGGTWAAGFTVRTEKPGPEHSERSNQHHLHTSINSMSTMLQKHCSNYTCTHLVRSENLLKNQLMNHSQ